MVGGNYVMSIAFLLAQIIIPPSIEYVAANVVCYIEVELIETQTFP